jgi:ubiquinone/menaquinone biosynthesis C-methylase UbiE
MHVNYEYLLEKCELLVPRNGRVLDYGCGKGSTVEEGVKRGLNIYGVEAFSHGSGTQIKEELQARGLYNKRVMELQGSSIPFPNHNFDLIISNQVFEHVVHLEEVLEEINRVLKPGGKLLCLFPSKEVFSEVHCGVPFVHRMSKSGARYHWLLFCRRVGLCRGRANKKRSNRQWAQFFNDWLVDSVTYRSIADIRGLFNAHVGVMEHQEHDYVAFRLKSKNLNALSRIAAAFPLSSFSAWIFRRLGCLNILVTKTGDA